MVFTAIYIKSSIPLLTLPLFTVYLPSDYGFLGLQLFMELLL